MWNKAEEDVMTESGVCVYVFCLLSSCSCTHTHCARRGINCPCSAIVTLLANLQGAHKSQPLQGAIVHLEGETLSSSPNTPISFPLPRAVLPLAALPLSRCPLLLPSFCTGSWLAASHRPRWSTHAAHGRYPATCQEARSSATYRERKLGRNP